jgi:hypothetical protein
MHPTRRRTIVLAGLAGIERTRQSLKQGREIYDSDDWTQYDENDAV